MVIRVTIEIVPLGIEQLARSIGTAVIINKGAGDDEQASYRYVVTSERWRSAKRGTLRSFQRSRGAWALLRDVLERVE